MQTVLLVAELIVAIALIVLVLLQRSEGGALGIGGGGGGNLFSPRGAADTLTRATAITAFLFFGICIGLNILALQGRPESSGSILLNQPAPAAPAPAPAPGVPSVPAPQ